MGVYQDIAGVCVDNLSISFWKKLKYKWQIFYAYITRSRWKLIFVNMIFYIFSYLIKLRKYSREQCGAYCIPIFLDNFTIWWNFSPPTWNFISSKLAIINCSILKEHSSSSLFYSIFEFTFIFIPVSILWVKCSPSII